MSETKQQKLRSKRGHERRINGTIYTVLVIMSIVWLVLGVVQYIVIKDRTQPFCSVDILMLKDAFSLITIYYGQDITEDDAMALQAELADRYPDCDVDLQSGGQPLYYYLVSVE